MPEDVILYWQHPAGVVRSVPGQGWFICRLDHNDKIDDMIGPLGHRDKAIQESINYFPLIFIVDILGNLAKISLRNGKKDEEVIEDNIPNNKKEISKKLVQLLKEEKDKNLKKQLTNI